MDLQQAIILRNKTIVKQQDLSSLQIPRIDYSKKELRTGMQGRIQRKEHKRFIETVKKQKVMYAKQRMELDNYISSLQSSVPIGEIGELGVSTVVSPIPRTSFLGTPMQRRIRNLKRRGER